MTKITQNLRRWSTPEHVYIETNISQPGIHIKDLSTSTLDNMVSDWIDDIYKSIDRSSPWCITRGW